VSNLRHQRIIRPRHEPAVNELPVVLAAPDPSCLTGLTGSTRSARLAQTGGAVDNPYL
jgi:hypothetical protein